MSAPDLDPTKDNQPRNLITDALLWRGLMGLQRIRLLGHAREGKPCRQYGANAYKTA